MKEPSEGSSLFNLEIDSDPSVETPEPYKSNSCSKLAFSFQDVLLPLLPSFFARGRNRGNEESNIRCLDTIRHLHGLRGVLSLVVMMDHFIVMFHPNLMFGYGQGI